MLIERLPREKAMPSADSATASDEVGVSAAVVVSIAVSSAADSSLSAIDRSVAAPPQDIRRMDAIKTVSTLPDLNIPFNHPASIRI